MRFARCVVVLLLAGSVVLAGPKPKSDEIAKLEKELADLEHKQAILPAVKVAKKLLEAQIQVTGKDSPEADKRRELLARAYCGAGDYNECRKVDAERLAYAEKTYGPESKEVYAALQELTRPDLAQFKLIELEPTQQRMLAITKKLHGADSVEYAVDLLAYGGLLSFRNEYTAAIAKYEEAVKIYEAKLPKGDPRLGPALQTLASFYWTHGEKSKAVPLFDKVIQLAEVTQNHTVASVGGTIWSVAATYHWGGREDLAKPLMKRALDMFDKETARLEKDKPDDWSLSMLYGMAGNMERSLNDFPAAEQRFHKAIAIDEKRNGFSGYTFMLAETVRASGRPKQALALYEQVEQETVKRAPSMANLYDSTIADVLRETGDFKGAEQRMLHALPGLEKTFGRKHPNYGLAELSLANIYMASHDFPKAERVLAESLDLAERELQMVLANGTEADHAGYVARNEYRLDGVVNFNYSLAPKNAAITRLALTTLLRRKGRALDASQAAMSTIRAKLAPADKQLLDNLAAARQKLSQLTVAGPQSTGDPAEYAREVAVLEDQIAKLEIDLGKKSAAYRAASAPIELAPVQKALPHDTKLVELVNFQPGDIQKYYQYGAGLQMPARRYAAYVLGGTGDPVFVDLAPAADIDTAVEKFRKAISDPKNTHTAELGRALYDLTVARIEPALGKSTEVLIAPDGALSVVPFSALVDAKGKFLVDKYNFTYLTSGRDLLRLGVRTKAKGGGVIFADPAFDATQKSQGAGSRGSRALELSELSWPALPGTGQEGAAVAKTMTSLKLLTGANATEGAVKALHGPRILHLATHGFFLPDDPPPASGQGAPKTERNPLLRSGLALAGANKLSSGDEDGILTALEASGLDLEGTELVVLSACETGVGKVTNGEGVYGLRRALVVAGAESLVMSLWQVDDEATRDLMVGYYAKLAAGHARSTALREEQLELRANAKYAHPYYWASFLPAGDNSPL
jgi:CHAT domain-containing protein